MDGLSGIGKTLVIFGALILVVGVCLLFLDKVPFLGRLPGDFRFQWKNVIIHAPLATCLVLSVILTILLNLFLKR